MKALERGEYKDFVALVEVLVCKYFYKQKQFFRERDFSRESNFCNFNGVIRYISWVKYSTILHTNYTLIGVIVQYHEAEPRLQISYIYLQASWCDDPNV